MKRNVCGVLAGAYRGKRASLKDLLAHYEVPGTNDALCGRVQEGGLSDQELGGKPTCKHCLRIAAKEDKEVES
jgi:hypothetical protein